MKQKTLIICFGELMLRLNTSSGLRFGQSAGFEVKVAGAEANVCVLLAHLGLDARYISRVPNNDLAVMATNELRKYGVDTDAVITGGERMALYFVEQGNHIRSTQVIYDRAHSSFASLSPGMINWTDSLRGGNIFHWTGVAAALSESAANVCKEAIVAARAAGLTISADFNYRRTLWNYGKSPREVMPELLKYAEIAVADLDSAAVYFDITTSEQLSFESRFKQCYTQLITKMPFLKTLAMSFRKVNGLSHEYFGALAHEGNFYFSQSQAIPYVTDQIGSGDAFTGGLLAAIGKGLEPQEMINWAVACGVLKQSVPGDWALIKPEEVAQFIQNGANSKINR